MTARNDAPPPPDEPPDDEAPLTHQPPNNQDAEKALLGVLLREPRLAPEAATLLDASDFYRPNHETLWHAIHAVTATGARADAILVLDHLQRHSHIRPGHLDGPYLYDCITASGEGLAQIHDYARIIRDTSRLRTAATGLTRVQHAISTATPDNVAQVLADLVDTADTVATRFGATRTTIRRHVETIDELLAGETDDTYDWVIPGLIEHQERVILTAEEGAGKSTLLRQIAIQAAAGLHPFTGELIDPITVLHIDVENTRRQSRRRYRPMRIQAGGRLDPERLRVELRTAGLDLTTPEDRDWLMQTCAHVQPDLLLIGPIYKLANGDPTEEKSAKPVAMAIDAVRDQTDCAVILEAHAPKASGGSKKRPHEPYGWSGWLRWPEVGIWLDTNGDITPWRGAREERAWPEKLERGGDWPWSAALTEFAASWNTIRVARQHHGEPMTIRQVAIVTGMSRSTVARLIGKNARYHYAWNGINGRAPQEDE